jgi:predicted alpha/beta-fold hydrolase
MRVIGNVARPAMILSAADDPFVPAQIFREPLVSGNPHIQTVITSHGGHCAFVEAANGYDGYWAERQVVEFLAAHAQVDSSQ